MSTSAISSASPVSASEAHALLRTASGEFTAESVEANPSQAAGLIKLKDGNYGQAIVAASDRYTAVTTDLTSLKLGG